MNNARKKNGRERERKTISEAIVLSLERKIQFSLVLFFIETP